MPSILRVSRVYACPPDPDSCPLLAPPVQQPWLRHCMCWTHLFTPDRPQYAIYAMTHQFAYTTDLLAASANWLQYILLKYSWCCFDPSHFVKTSFRTLHRWHQGGTSICKGGDATKITIFFCLTSCHLCVKFAKSAISVWLHVVQMILFDMVWGNNWWFL